MDPASVFLGRLRAETAASHRAIEDIPAFSGLMAAGVTRDHLVALLWRLHSFHSALHLPMALALEPIAGASAFRDATRLDALVEDLAYFGFRPEPVGTREAAPEMASPGHALGYLYVIEGSSLGGRVIARRLEETLGVTASGGARFFGGRTGAETGVRFRGLMALLDREAACGETADAIIAGACEAFGQFSARMTAPLAAFSGG